MKSIDLQSKVIFANTLAPHWMKGQFPKNYFAGKLMKHPDLHRKLKFYQCTTSHESFGRVEVNL